MSIRLDELLAATSEQVKGERILSIEMELEGPFVSNPKLLVRLESGRTLEIEAGYVYDVKITAPVT